MVKSRARINKKNQPASHPKRLLIGGPYCELGQLVAMTDPDRTPDLPALSRSLPRGTIIILRHNDVADREDIAALLRRITRQRRQLLFISGDHRLARKVGADGLHLRRADLFSMRKPWKGLISTACHDVKAIKRSREIGADFLLVSPLFSTRSHVGQKPLGLYRWIMLTSWHRRQHYIALGGINMNTVGRLGALSKVSGPAGLAAIDGLRR